MILRGNLIKLRALEPGDVDLLYLWENDPDVWTISNTLKPFSKYTLQQFIESSVADIYETKQLRLILDDIKSGQAAGIIDIFDFDPFHKRAGIGILIAEQFRRSGFATESIALVKEYLFSILQLHQIYCNIMINNPGSIELFKKAGFEICGHKKEWILTQEGYCDEIILQCFNPKTI